MLNLQNLKVKIYNTDIAPMVLSLTMFESIKGNIRGSIVVQDNINFYDTFIGLTQTPIEIHHLYLGYQYINKFYGDGISDMKILKLGKQYNIHFIAYTTMNEQVKKINQVYSGTSDEIIESIFRETNGTYKQAPLRIDSKAITNGKYVVPNIKAHSAINNVVNSAYDENKSGFCLYQRVCDQGMTRLTSFHDMDKNWFYENQAAGNSVKFTIKNTLVGIDNESDGLSSLNTVGTSSSFTLDEYQMNFTSKLAEGFWGNKIQHIQLDETKTKDFPISELTDIPIIDHIISDKLYDSDTKSLFSTSSTPDSLHALNQKRRVFNQYLTVTNVVSIPSIGCGFCIDVDQGGSNISKTKTDDNYIIANINHKFILNDGEYQYSQDIGLIRDPT